MKHIIIVLLYLWQLPQNLLGLVLWACRHRDRNFKFKIARVGIDDRFVSNRPGDRTCNGISLGRYIILEKRKDKALRHEFGHCRQSMILGPLYLPVVGLSSGVHNLVHRYKIKHNLPRRDYYVFWTERWADRLGDVKRKYQ